MASPQLENGHLKLANELVEALMRTNLSGYQMRVLWAVWRKTYGWNKKEDWISNSQLIEMTGIRKQHISRTIKELLDRNIVTKSGYKIAFNKDYTQWRELPKQVTVTSRGYRVTNSGNGVTSLGAHKRHYTKDTLTKDTTIPEPYKQYLLVLISIPGYPLNVKTDIAFFREKEQDFPSIDILSLLKGWKDYLLDHPFSDKSSPRSQLSSQFKLAVKWNKHPKSNGSGPRKTGDDIGSKIKQAEREFSV